MKLKLVILQNKISILLLCLFICMIAAGFNACSKSSGGNGSNGNNGNNGSANSVSIKGFAFSVNSLAVTKGTTVTWTNNDAVTHTVTADDDSFDSGNITPGTTYSHTFNSTGTFAYHCSIHTSMKANVVVQ